jgi:hypothetical protein
VFFDMQDFSISESMSAYEFSPLFVSAGLPASAMPLDSCPRFL